MKGNEAIVVPFTTINQNKVDLYVIADETASDTPKCGLVESWKVDEENGATRLLAAMYRLADWAIETGAHLINDMPDVVNNSNMKGIGKTSVKSSFQSTTGISSSERWHGFERLAANERRI